MNNYTGPERRKFPRLEHVTPLNYKICNPQIIAKLLQGYTSDISPAGLLCDIKDKVKVDDILWLVFDRDTLSFCQDIEKRSLIYQHGVIGKVVRVDTDRSDSFRVGVQFITREERSDSLICNRIDFLEASDKANKQ